MPTAAQQWHQYLQRYSSGEWRARVFRDMILADIGKLAHHGRRISILDIGCGSGFDNDPGLQRSIAEVSAQYIGIEPDVDAKLQNIFTSVHRCSLQEAPLQGESIDLAFAVMVLEHLREPQGFWDRVFDVLRDDGVFWGFTMDARHWFAFASFLTGKLGIKNRYLNWLHGKSGKDRYDNYCVYYRSNTPEQIRQLTLPFSSRTVLNFSKVGELDYYLPNRLMWLGKTLDEIRIRLGLPGSIIAVRVQK